ncbi:DEAD/DEAH box helicase [Halalkalicoccus jeotgali]|uniref:DNA 3'-5' helicase n=1 Tax=Halalkalicoccus jeotgali (strain DSM 18796 / CECT 7217 / JCM 14584 / KCTC 4019 / B3) TaxID=795797 RepID=D8J6S4_HALJB|nr:DEAD/DEAH box helicase family protein [Halalkalicoccus jeotgali]ADJ15877.1 DNA repair protein Rad25 [Halalkalicoccus jeotgali B3]ELY37973.1 DNA repair protein Rad25 [Halalkalicoccus jeotgali B3]
MAIRLTYEDGTIRASGPEREREAVREAVPSDPILEYDPRSLVHRAPAFRYADLRVRLDERDIEYADLVFDRSFLRGLVSAYELRSYQQAALDAWDDNGNRGVLELPTGSGKTVIAMKAIETLACPTLIVVPTIDLLNQWREELRAEFDIPVGQFGGGVQSMEAITVSTYDSAYLKADSVGDVFSLVVFDEVHHLGGEGYREIARLLAAPARLGLTATFERPDGAHELIEDLVGPVVYRTSAEELAGEHLAPYDVKRIEVSLTEREREEYERNQETFVSYLRESGIEMRRGSDYQELVKRSGSDPRAREALLAKQHAREIVSNAERKVEQLGAILERHHGERIIVFTAHNDLVYRLSERFLIPAITHRTGTKERREVLDRFREGTYSRVVASNVLDEGVDVPDASVAVVLSGSGSEREFTQRLGRILRPGEGKRALLYELVSEDTAEENVAARRR